MNFMRSLMDYRISYLKWISDPLGTNNMKYVPIVNTQHDDVLFPEWTITNNDILIAIGIYPDAWKQARITPIFKSGDRLNVCNYRPVASLPFISKVADRVLFNQLNKIVGRMTPKNAYGGSFEKSAEHLLLHIYFMLVKALDSKKCVIVMTTDVSKAYDSVPRDQVISDVKSLGAPENLCRLLQNYFTNRYMMICDSTNCDYLQESNMGVIQGTVTAPMFYSIFTLDLHKLGLQSELFTYVDDNFLVCSCEYTELLEWSGRLDCDLIKLSDWYKKRGMVLNRLKFSRIVIDRRRTAFKGSEGSMRMLGVFF